MEKYMYKILNKQILNENVKLVVVKAPVVAAKARAGQFVIVRINETGERIPLTIADYSLHAETITLIFQEIGKSTMQMGMLEVGDGFENVVGPLGHPTEIRNYGRVLLVGGGVGIATLFPIARALKQAGNSVTTILGARTRHLLVWEDEVRAWSDETIVCTDDGSYGRKGVVTGSLKELLDGRKDISRIWAIGPTIMMKVVADTTRPYGVPTIVSLNTIMLDGTGMCGSCRILKNGRTQFACVDGPEFDAHSIDWDNLLLRMNFYQKEEQLAVERWQRYELPVDFAFSAAVR
jgi:ferredoxin/flavodoxin---NADP+ reductase